MEHRLNAKSLMNVPDAFAIMEIVGFCCQLSDDRPREDDFQPGCQGDARFGVKLAV